MAHGAEFQEIAHCGGQFIVTVTTDANGRRGVSFGVEHSAPRPAAWFAVYALPPGVAVAMIELGGIGQPWNPPPYRNCLPVFIGSDSEGLFGHQCPECEGYWRSKAVPPTWRLTCPYCGTSGGSHQFLTTGQRRFVEAEVDLAALPYVRLPKAPAYWERRQQQETEDRADRVWAETVRVAEASLRRASASQAALRFAADGEGWRILSEHKLAPEQRPDPAYKDTFPTSGSTFWLDPHGRREGFDDAAAVLRVTDRAGSVVAERSLAHGVYRADVNTDGSAILFMSREGVLHGYSDRIEQILTERVEDLPEYRAQAERLGIDPRELRTHVRSVAISADRSRYLVTVVDEAWCASTATGEVLWGIRLPAREGWTKVATPRVERLGTSRDAETALQLMELELPVAPADITRQYRRLAMQWHPDRNPNDPDATRRFQELAAAMELLTGADLRGMALARSSGSPTRRF